MSLKSPAGAMGGNVPRPCIAARAHRAVQVWSLGEGAGVAAAGAGGGGVVRGVGGRAWGGWLLLVVLAVQAVLSVRLVGTDTAFVDEATYLWAGHLEWAHWLHGAPVPPFAAYFSGAPVIYPPLGALADGVWGLAGARVLSLVLMLGATVLLWGTAGRLFGRRAAFFAAALFAVLGTTLHLGAFATYDALSVVLVAAAAWCVVRAVERGEGTGWMIAAGAALALANAVAYSSALFDVVVLVLAWVSAVPLGAKVAARRCAVLLVVVIVLVTGGLLAGGSSYLAGVRQTTLARAAGPDSPLSVLADAWSWTGLVLVLAVCGVIISWAGRHGRAQTWLLAVLAAAAVLGPLEQARLHTLASLNKHVGLGVWFAAIAAGYAVDRFLAAASACWAQAVACGACVAALVFPVTLGPASHGRFPPIGRTRPASSRSCARWPITAAAACWSKTPPSHGTTCPPGVSGSDGHPPATSPCPQGPAPAAPPAAPASPVPAMPASSPSSSPMVISP